MLLLNEVNLSSCGKKEKYSKQQEKLSIRSVCFVLPIDIHNIHNTKVSTWFFFDEVTENLHLVLKLEAWSAILRVTRRRVGPLLRPIRQSVEFCRWSASTLPRAALSQHSKNRSSQDWNPSPLWRRHRTTQQRHDMLSSMNGRNVPC